MKVVAAILFLAFASTSFATPIGVKAVDWEKVLVETIEIHNILETEFNKITNLVGETSLETAEALKAIFDEAILKIGKILEVIANEVMDQTLTAGQARAQFYQMDMHTTHARESMMQTISILHPTLIKEVEDSYDNTMLDVVEKQKSVIYLLSVDP